YGFAPAVPMAAMTIDTRRAGWAAGAPAGRLEYLDKAALRDNLAALYEVERTQRSGQVAGWERRWDRFAGLAPGNPSAAAVRGVRYLDQHGAARGVLAYTLAEIPGAFRFELKISLLTA